MTDNTCRSCGHYRHLHRAGAGCRVTTISGPADNTGKAVGDGYQHGSRDVTRCGCRGYAGLNGAVL